MNVTVTASVCDCALAAFAERECVCIDSLLLCDTLNRRDGITVNSEIPQPKDTR